MRFLLDSLVSGAGPGNRGGDFATFRAEYDGMHPHRPSRGEYKIATADWIKRGRPTSIEVDVPPVVEP